MKKFLSLAVVAAMMLAMAVPAMAADPIQIPTPNVSIAVDGSRDEGYAGPYAINTFFPDGDPDGATGQLWTAWDGSSLFLYVEVNDTTPNHEHGNSYERDCVEIFIDFLNAREEDTGDETKAYWQLRIMSAPNEDGVQFEAQENQAAYGWSSPNNDPIAEMVQANSVINLTGSGYVIETKIDISSFDYIGLTLAEGVQIGFDFVVSDNKNDEQRDSMAYLGNNPTNNQYQYPVDCGATLVLGGAPVVELPPEEPVPNGGGDTTPTPTPTPTPPRTGDAGMIVLVAVMAIASMGIVVLKRKAVR